LRQRLESFYEGSSGPRLLIPNGEYRVVLFDPPSEAGRDISSSRARARVSAKRIGAVILAINALLWGALILTGHQRRAPNVLAATSFWRSLSAGAQPAQIVVGDSYLFAETKNEKDVERLIMQPDIRSRKDLDAYLVGHPKDFYKLYDLDIHYASGATLKAVWSLMPVIHALEHSVEMPDLIPASSLSYEVLKTRDLIYIGRLDGLGAFRVRSSTPRGLNRMCRLTKSSIERRANIIWPGLNHRMRPVPTTAPTIMIMAMSRACLALWASEFLSSRV